MSQFRLLERNLPYPSNFFSNICNIFCRVGELSQALEGSECWCSVVAEAVVWGMLKRSRLVSSSHNPVSFSHTFCLLARVKNSFAATPLFSHPLSELKQFSAHFNVLSTALVLVTAPNLQTKYDTSSG